MKTKFLKCGMFVKFQFVPDEDGMKETRLTMFQDAITSIIPNWEKLAESDIKNQLLLLDEMKLEVNKKNVKSCST